MTKEKENHNTKNKMQTEPSYKSRQKYIKVRNKRQRAFTVNCISLNIIEDIVITPRRLYFLTFISLYYLSFTSLSVKGFLGLRFIISDSASS